ncbi:MAG: site-2 protease family protein [Proteobacteria bacterium]|nr:site-2 protease family protein [Pseudomonadota bacterium]
MFDPAPESEGKRFTPAERWITAALVLGFGAAMAVEILDPDQPAKLVIPLALVFWVPLLVLHELGHAAAAHLCGWRVREIVIGYGRPVARWRWGDTSVELRRFPVVGFVRCSPIALGGARLKSAFIYFAGPGIELALVGLLVWAVAPRSLFQPADALAWVALQSAALAALAGAGINLLPHASLSRDGSLPSDGLGILLSLLRPPSYYAALRARADLEDAEDARPSGSPGP